MKLKLKPLFTMLIVVMLLAVIIMPLGLQAVTETEIATETQSWLSQQLQTYGVPAGLSAAIGIVAGYGLTYLISRGLRRTTSGINTSVATAVSTLQITNENALKLIATVEACTKQVEQLTMQNQLLVEEVREFKGEVVVLQNQNKTLQAQQLAKESELHEGAVLIINTLTEAFSKSSEV